MKFSAPAFLAFASVALATAESAAEPRYLNVPQEAILAASPISNDLVPVVVTKDGQQAILIVNGTLADEIENAERNQKREADPEAWHWLSKMSFQPIFKREADPEAWHWLSKMSFQPIFKREANAEAWHWLSKMSFQPIF